VFAWGKDQVIGTTELDMVDLLEFVSPDEILSIRQRLEHERGLYYQRIINRFIDKKNNGRWKQRIFDMIGKDIWVHLPGEDRMVDYQGRMLGINEVDGKIQATMLCRGEKVTFDPFEYCPHLVRSK
jgi:hypothetical protein